MRRALSWAAAGALLAGCASFDGGGLAAGKATEAETIALMGEPAQRLTLPGGGAALYFSRMPQGRAVYVAEFGPDGLLRSVEQRLLRANLARIAAGASTMKEVRELFGPPGRSGRIERQARTWWEYRYSDHEQGRVIWVQYSDDGVVREVLDMLDWEQDKPGLYGMP